MKYDEYFSSSHYYDLYKTETREFEIFWFCRWNFISVNFLSPTPPTDSLVSGEEGERGRQTRWFDHPWRTSSTDQLIYNDERRKNLKFQTTICIVCEEARSTRIKFKLTFRLLILSSDFTCIILSTSFSLSSKSA